jgi:hypothetical protein
MYASVADMRTEGVSVETASDARIAAILAEASSFIDRATGWFFEPRQTTLLLHGAGKPELETPCPPIELQEMIVDGERWPPSDVITVGSPVQPGFFAPKLVAARGIFQKGRHNIRAKGLWGYTTPSAQNPHGETPPEIRRVAMLCALRLLPPLTAEASQDARHHWRVIEERTRDQSYRLGPQPGTEPFTGDPEIDRVLRRYRRPAGLGAA